MPNGVPSTTADSAQFTGTSTYTAEIATGITYTVGSVLLDDANATFDLLGNLSVGTSTASGMVTITSGTLIIDSASGAGNNSRLRYATVADNGGTVEFAGGTLIDVTWQGTLDLSAANAKVKANVNGTSSPSNDATIALTVEGAGGVGNGTVLVTGSGSSFGLLDYQTFNNATVDLGAATGSAAPASLVVSESSGNTTGAAQVTLGSGVQVTSDGTNALAQISSKTATDVIINQGTITAGASGGSFGLAAVLTNQGTIQVQNGDTLTISADTVTNAATGTITVDATSTLNLNSTLIDQGGAITIAPGGVFEVGGSGMLTGYGTVTGNVTIAGTAEASGGTLAITGSAGGTGGTGLVVLPNATLTIGGSVSVPNVTFSGGGPGETVGFGTLTNTTTIHQFYSGDTIWLTNLDDSTSSVSASYANGTLTILDGGTAVGSFGMAPPYSYPSATPAFYAVADMRGGTDITTDGTAACYVAGTRIAVPGGEAPIEQLAIGDHVLTASGAARPIVWIGRRSYGARFTAGRRCVLPVLIRAGALDGMVPQRDLMVSPRHAMYVDGLLVPANALVNGSSIVQLTAAARVDYVHIELASHDVILAEGAPSESFVDDDSRGLFHNAHEFAALYPGATRCPAAYCAPRCDHGYEVEVIRCRIAALAKAGPNAAATPRAA
jgi:hypothetical protein